MTEPLRSEVEPHPDDWHDLLARREATRRQFYARQPHAIADVMAEVVQRRGYGQVRSGLELRQAWYDAAGEPFARVTEPGVVRRGVLEVTAANSLVMQELSFEKERILAALQATLPEAGLKNIRCRVGPIG